MSKFLTPGLEREFLQKINSAYALMSEENVLDKKLCHDCLSRGISKWLSLYPAVKKRVYSKLKAYVEEVKNNTLPEVCSACNKNSIALCPYCFSEGVFNLLKQNRVDVMVIMDYLSTFNFDSRHEGMIKNAINKELFCSISS